MRELGTKFVCFKCQTKFYDLKKPAPVCPKCGADQRDVPPPTKSERKKAAAAPAPVSRLEAVEDTDEDALKDEEGEEEEEVEEEDA